MLTDEQRAYHRDWYHRNKEARRQSSRERMRANRAKDPTSENEAGKRWRSKMSADQRTDRHLKRTYGITLEQRDLLFAKQGAVCAICKRPDRPAQGWHVDHCHETKRIRGILCNNCNLMIGHAKDNPTTLISAAEYLK